MQPEELIKCISYECKLSIGDKISFWLWWYSAAQEYDRNFETYGVFFLKYSCRASKYLCEKYESPWSVEKPEEDSAKLTCHEIMNLM